MGAAFSWRNIASKLKQLEAQWTEATRAARQVVSTNGSSSYASSGNRRMSSGIGGSRMGTAGSPSSGMLTSRSTASTMSTSTFGTAASRFTTAGGGSGSSTSEATMGRTMAEKARQWISASAVGTPLAQLQHVDASMATRDALQVECLSLLSALEAWETSVAEETELTMSTATNPQQQQHQLRRLWLQRCEQHSTIQSIVQRLLALMVVQPGSTADDIESTAGVRATDSMIQDASGRDVQHSAVGRLIHQVEEDVFPRVKKSSALLQSWTSLCDSAVMEHVLHLVEKLSSFGRSTKKAMEESVQKISTLSKILQEMMRHVAQAEDSRVAGFGLSTTGASSSSKGKGGTISARSASSTSDNTAVVVSPMDSLCRGIAGPEVASLMQVLRQHHHTFRDLDDELQELVQRFVKTLLWEQAGMQSFIRASLGHEIPSTAAVEEMKPPPVGRYLDSEEVLRRLNDDARVDDENRFSAQLTLAPLRRFDEAAAALRQLLDRQPANAEAWLQQTEPDVARVKDCLARAVQLDHVDERTAFENALVRATRPARAKSSSSPCASTQRSTTSISRASTSICSASTGRRAGVGRTAPRRAVTQLNEAFHMLWARSEDQEVLSERAAELYRLVLQQSPRIVAALPCWETTREADACRTRDSSASRASLPSPSVAASSSTATTVVTGSSDGSVCVWDLGLHRRVDRFEAHHDAVWSVSFNNLDGDGHTFASGAEDGTICLFQRDAVEYL
eukprot:gene5274-3767_t